MKVIDWLTLLAIILGPILAVQAQKWIEKFKEKKDRKLNVFKTLMATRGARLLFEHVRALNMIDIEFVENKDVTDAWKCYLDCLNEQIRDNESALNNWAQKRDELFVDLLSIMAKKLGYRFDNVHLKKAVYFPKAHGQEEEYQQLIRNYILKISKGEESVPIKITPN